MKAIVNVVGKDQVGIIAGICTELAGKNVNVLDITQTIMEGFFTMTMIVDLEKCATPLKDLVDQLDAFGKQRGLSVRIQREDIFDAMHEI